MKSMTWPRATPGSRMRRSTRLPSAPPSSSPRAMAQPVEPRRRDTRTTTTTTAHAMSVRTHVSPVAMDSAAPELKTSLSPSRSPSSGRRTVSSRFASAHALVAWSTRSTPSVSTTTSATSRRRGPSRLGATVNSSARMEDIGDESTGASATLFALLALHAQDRARERLDACLADRLAARLAGPEGPRRDARQRVLRLHEEVPRVVDERELLLALERTGTRVGLVVACPVARVAQQLGEVGISRRELRPESVHVADQLIRDRPDLTGGPWLLAVTDRELTDRLREVGQVVGARLGAERVLDGHEHPLCGSHVRVGDPVM